MARRRGKGPGGAALRASPGRGRGLAIEEWHEEYFGVDAFGGPTVAAGEGSVGEPPEVIGRLAWRAADREVAGAVGGAVGVLGLSGPPTIAGTGRGRDGRPSQLLSVDPIEVPRELVDGQVMVDVQEV